MVLLYSSRFNRRTGAGPGVMPLMHAWAFRLSRIHAARLSRCSIAGAGRFLGGISPLRTRVRMRFQRSGCCARLAAPATCVISNPPAGDLP